MSIKNIKIAYIGGGSRGWAWGLMSDLAQADDICGEVALYDIDFEAAQHNEIIGNKVKDAEGCKSEWTYKAYPTIGEALTGADFVVISILPGTFDEMDSDVHAPEKYGIYQSVGDTIGPGGIVRALRTIPMYEEIALAIKEYSPNAWVISYTNPMTMCMRALYRVFPEIKAFGCCHEVFGTQKLLAMAVGDIKGIEKPERHEIKTNVVGINHFTWITEASYNNMDLFPIYTDFCKKYAQSGVPEQADNNWMNNSFASRNKVAMDLFQRHGYIAAAGDRHLAEFCPKSWYLENPERVHDMMFGLTTVDYRKKELKERLARSERLMSGEEKFELNPTGEEGVNQIRALLGLKDLVTNVNIPNYGQIPNLPLGAIVETNAVFRKDSVRPVFAGDIPDSIYSVISRIVGEQETVVEACLTRNLALAYSAFSCDNLVDISLADSKKLFKEMVENTAKYLPDYDLNELNNF